MTGDGDHPQDAPRWQRLQDIFAEARAAEGDDRERLLLDRCAGDAALLRELRALLAADASTGALDVLAPRLASVVDVLDDAAPETIGPYTIDQEAGRGGMGIVYRGFDPRLRRHVAIKLVAREVLGDPAARVRFINEARLASTLDHPNICTIYDIGTLPDGRIYLAMAYYGRGTLADRLADGPFAVEDAVAIARQLADALVCAHAAGIVHRDVKPRNVAFGERGEARLLDFGIALLGHDTDVMGPTAGTPGYMAPEQVRGDRVDGRADVWALGVVLFEMIAGRRPFDGDRAAVLRAITETDAPGLLDLRPDVPPPIAAIVARALRRDAAERFTTMGELDAALADAVAGQPAQPGPAHGVPAPRGTAIRRAAVAAALVAATGVIAFVAQLWPGDAPSDAATARGRASDYYERGRARYNEGINELESAIALFRSAVEHDPTHALAHAFLARAYARATLADAPRQGQSEWADSAELHAQRALELAPGLADGYAALGSVARARGQPDAALEHHARALAIDPRYVYSMAEIGEIYRVMRQIGDAILWHERALDVDPTLDEVRVALIIMYRSWELADQARRHIQTGLELRPDNADLLWEAAQLEVVLGDTAAARQYFAAFLPLRSAFERDRLTAWYEYIRGSPHDALPYVERVAPAASAWWDLRMYGMVFIGAGDTTRGRPLLRRALDAVQASAEVPGALYQAEFIIAHLSAGLGQNDEALRRLAAWEEAGGFRSWGWIDRETGWRNLRDDARFQQIVTRTDSVFRQRRTEIEEALSTIQTGH